MQKSNRVLSIDVMRGITLFLMLFVNDLYQPGVPGWLTHRPADFNGMGLADWVFPGFLFIVGMSIPYAIQNRIKRGDSNRKLIYHIILRTVSLLVIGVLMYNVPRNNPELSGISSNWWALFMYISVFLVWNKYRNMRSNFIFVFQGVGIFGLIVLVTLFRAGTPENIDWLRIGWWGILGIIGWGYLVAALTYFAFKDNLLKTSVVWVFFIIVNILSQLGMLGSLDSLKPFFGVVLSGDAPSIVLAGLVFSLLLRKYTKDNFIRFFAYGTILAGITFGAGFILRHWFIVSKIHGTPSWAMICNAISMFLFIVLYLVVDILERDKWAFVFKSAGRNSLTTYLAPFAVYYVIWISGFDILFYKNSGNAIAIITGSLVWSLVMVGFTALLSKIGIRLKL